MLTLTVECYSGYKADERPVSFVLGDEKLMVEKIIDQWRSPDHEDFKVLADGRKGYVKNSSCFFCDLQTSRYREPTFLSGRPDSLR